MFRGPSGSVMLACGGAAQLSGRAVRRREVMQEIIRYSERVVRRVAIRTAWHRTGLRLLLGIGLILVAIVPALRRGDRSWWVGVGATMIVLALLFAAVVFVSQWRLSLGRFRKLENGCAQISLTNDHLRFEGTTGAVEYSWGILRYLERHPEYWILGPSKRSAFMLATDGLSQESQAFILEKLGKARAA
jgi:hypothetical protein